MILPLFTLCLFFIARVASHEHQEDISATCVIEPLGFPGMNISGTIKLQQPAYSNFTTVVGHLYGFENKPYSERGFHVHEFGSTAGNCSAAGLHYNPFNKTHGAPNDTERHVGDLGNIVVDSNLRAFINITDSVIALHGNYSIINRTLVVHSYIDDLGKGGNETSKSTGNSGYRIGCCIITMDQQTTTGTSTTTQTVSAGTTTYVEPLTRVLLMGLTGLQLLMKSIQL